MMHIMVEDGKPSKEAPCVECGEMCLVHAFYATEWVKCPAHKRTRVQKERRRQNVLDPFETGITLEQRRERVVGAVVELHRAIGVVEWDEVLTVTDIKEFNEETGVVVLNAAYGENLPKFDPHREQGQRRTILRKEVTNVR